MSSFSETDVAMMLHGRTECQYCGRYVLCLALHQCSTEMARPVPVPVVDREPVRLPGRWKDKESA